MVAPAIAAVAAKAAPLIAKAVPALKSIGGKFLSGLGSSGSGGLLGSLGSSGGGIGNIASSLGKFLGNFKSGSDNSEAAQAYQSYLNGISSDMQNQLEARAEKYDQKLQGQFNQAEPQFQQESNTQLAELQQLMTDIANQSAESQRQNQRQINASLAQQGVRGGQAAILANRATGELNRDLQRDINQTAYNEAANRQNARLNYYSDKALTPWKAMSNAYGQSMVGANNALSDAQGFTYKNAYNRAMDNYGNTQKKKGLF